MMKNLFGTLMLVIVLHDFAATEEKSASKLPLTVQAITQQGNKDSYPNETFEALYISRHWETYH